MKGGKSVNRTRLAVVFILFFVGASLISSASGPQNDVRRLIVPHAGFGLGSVVTLSWNGNETSEPLPPGGSPRNVNLTVMYYTVLVSPFVGKLILLYCLLTHQEANVTLEIGDTPSWCTASLSESQLQFPITGDTVSRTVSVIVAVDEHAPAYQLCPVPIHVSVDTLRGPFGLLPFVNGYDQTFTMCFFPGYLPHISVVPASDHLNATPGNTSYLPINITNHGNARTAVMIQITEHLPGWITYIPGQVIIDVNMSEETGLSVVPPSDFQGTESITISFTPYKADDYSQHGDPVYVTITIICEP